MTAQELNAYINKVLGNSIRCLLPSYWWRRLLSQIVGYVESVDGKSESAYKAIKGLCGFIITTGNEESEVFADGKNITIPANTTRKISFIERFKNVSYNIEGIMSIDTSFASTSNVTDMRDMFNCCYKLISIDVSNFDTSNVTDMSGMFGGCNSLTSIDLSNFNTSKVTFMNSMFSACHSLTYFDLSNFDTSNVTNMGNMFWECDGLTSLDVSNFNTSNVTDMQSIFANCKGLASLDVSNFNTSKVTSMYKMFCGCKGLISLDVSNFDTSNVTDMNSMFYNCISLVTLTLGADFFKVKSLDTPLDFSSLANWSSESAIPSLVTNSYDRTANGLANITLKLHTNTYAHLTDEHKATLTSKGYNVVSA